MPDHSASLRGLRVWITGSNGGIGYATAKACLEDGARVILHGRDRDKLDEAAKSLADAGEIATVVGDLTLPEDISRCASEATTVFGGLDAVVNNAGVAKTGSSGALDLADGDYLFRVNALAPYYVSHAVLKDLEQSGWGGNVVNITSFHAQTSVPGRTLYAASKAACESVTRSLAMEWASKGVRVNAVAPGYVETLQIKKLLDKAGEAIKRRTPLGRITQVEDVAAAVCFLLSKSSNQITGEVLRVDGGWVPYGHWTWPL